MTKPSTTAAVELALGFDEKVLVESAVSGREIECAVLGNEDAIASGCGEIVVRSGFYSYDSKYIDAQAAEVVVPATSASRPVSAFVPWPSRRFRCWAVPGWRGSMCS